MFELLNFICSIRTVYLKLSQGTYDVISFILNLGGATNRRLKLAGFSIMTETVERMKIVKLLFLNHFTASEQRLSLDGDFVWNTTDRNARKQLSLIGI